MERIDDGKRNQFKAEKGIFLGAKKKKLWTKGEEEEDEEVERDDGEEEGKQED